MNYLLDNDTVLLKDTWTIVENDEVHLFYLADNPKGSLSDRVFGHAVSTDWLHWRTFPPIDPRGEA